MNKMERIVLIDTDAGVDDVTAMFLCLSAHKDPKIQLRIVGITCVTGNTNVDNVCVNVARVLSAANVVDVPIFKGCDVPMVVPYFRGDSHHGSDGFGDTELPIPLVELETQHAVLAIIKLAKKFPDQLSILALGPLTNLAMAFRLDPSIVPLIKDVCHMGGNAEAVTDPTFNFKGDPEAAFVVFSCFTYPITLVPYETCKKYNLKDFRVNQLAKLGTQEINMLNKIEHQNLYKGFYAPCDPLVAAIFLQPSVVKSSRQLHITIDLTGCRGQMVIDHGDEIKNVNVVTDFEVDLYKEILKKELGGELMSDNKFS